MAGIDDAARDGRDARGRLLVVEDQPAILRLVAATLRSRGFEVHEADRGDRALSVAVAAGGPLRAAVLDLGLPGRSGREVAADLRARWPGLPVLFMTGSGEPEDDPDAPPSPGQMRLQKPFTPDELLRRVGELLA
jgi:DNA-binding response OmpR family regulator